MMKLATTIMSLSALFCAHCISSVSSLATPQLSLFQQRKGYLEPPKSSVAGFYDAAWQGNNDHDEELFEFVKMTDDLTRRDDFESFIRKKVLEQKLHEAENKISDLPFVKSVNESLVRLGQSVQDEAWEKHVVSGFSDTIALQQVHLWACVDMLIQFKVLVKNLEGSKTHTKLMAKKSKGCNQCTVCKCKNKKP